MARLPDYLRALTELVRQDIDTVSSGELADAAGVSAAQLRRDLSYLGSHGVRGVGYDTAHLATEIGRRLGVERQWPVVVVGAGRLGQALAGYPGLADGSFRIAALLDADPRVIGGRVGRLTIGDVSDLAAVVAEQGPVIGLIATSGEGAQDACDALVAAGVTSVLTFVSGHLRVPEGVRLRRVDVANELAVLAFHAHWDELRDTPSGADAGATVASRADDGSTGEGTTGEGTTGEGTIPGQPVAAAPRSGSADLDIPLRLQAALERAVPDELLEPASGVRGAHDDAARHDTSARHGTPERQGTR